jgi:hypothetical protein
MGDRDTGGGCQAVRQGTMRPRVAPTASNLDSTLHSPRGRPGSQAVFPSCMRPDPSPEGGGGRVRAGPGPPGFRGERDAWGGLGYTGPWPLEVASGRMDTPSRRDYDVTGGSSPPGGGDEPVRDRSRTTEAWSVPGRAHGRVQPAPAPRDRVPPQPTTHYTQDVRVSDQMLIEIIIRSAALAIPRRRGFGPRRFP